ncbi:YihY/virulence factor BrkB family protein [Kitasatospora sp. NPDC058162]|uniref:YihY/virulence factor BrkB family protein n=1 Tax=Kitasatospora sp. NPDC058162 TaxID=3346362 RepID=UPI0036DC201E
MNPVERGLRSVDGFQQRHRPIAAAVGVVRKYGDDRGGLLAALISYYGFLALIPLLLLLSTVLGFVLHGNPGAQRSVLDSALADFPIIGDQLRQNVHSLQGSGFALAVGMLFLLYGALGIAQVLQHAMAEIWNVPGVSRPGYWPRLARSLLLLVVLGAGLVLGTGAASVVASSLGGPAARVGGLLVSALLNAALCLVCFRVLTPRGIPTRALRPGCAIAGPLFTVLQAFGSLLVVHELRHAGQVYGFFATVIGLLSWLYLAAQITVFAAETNVVLARRLWPRSLLQPPLTDADEQVLGAIARQEERRPEQRVDVEFTDHDPKQHDTPGAEGRGGEPAGRGEPSG